MSSRQAHATCCILSSHPHQAQHESPGTPSLTAAGFSCVLTVGDKHTRKQSYDLCSYHLAHITPAATVFGEVFSALVNLCASTQMHANCNMQHPRSLPQTVYINHTRSSVAVWLLLMFCRMTDATITHCAMQTCEQLAAAPISSPLQIVVLPKSMQVSPSNIKSEVSLVIMLKSSRSQ